MEGALDTRDGSNYPRVHYVDTVLYVIHASRWWGSRRTIDLKAGQPDPRITEWPKPGTVKSKALSRCPQT